ncbi:MAG: hypothetical protein K5899_03665 [Bacteroidaceae bacterium]|nr:hypothetical protein [Bacteroidaceae bacterium]
MKTKLLIMLAAMLLSANAFAQSENTPLKGDVNGDGKVDVADINEIIKIMKDAGGTAGETVYYWYVGTIPPTDPSNSAQNTGLNKWTTIGSSLPTSDIYVVKKDETGTRHTWYIAAPTNANFILYNGTNVASDEAGWNKSTFNIGTIQYTLWTCKLEKYKVGNYLHKT